MFLERIDTRKPASVRASWDRLERWFKQHHPMTFDSLISGCSEQELNRAEAKIGRKLPICVRESLMIHDGCAASCDPEEATIGFVFGWNLHSLEDIVSEYESWRSIGEEGHFGDDFTSYPMGAIARQYVDVGWIPLAGADSNCIGVDLQPRGNGVTGQVINFGRDENAKFVLAESWAHFLEDLADELERGELVAVASDDSGQFPFLQWIEQPQSRNFLKEWAEAKLPMDFRHPPSLDPVVNGTIIDDAKADECKLLVMRLLRELDAHGPIPISGGSNCHKQKELFDQAQSLNNASEILELMQNAMEKYRQSDAGKQIEAWRQARQAILFKYVEPHVARQFGMADENLDVAQVDIECVRKMSDGEFLISLAPIGKHFYRFHLKQLGDRLLIMKKDYSEDQVDYWEKAI